MIDRKTYEKEYMGKIVSDEEIINFLQNVNRNLKKENAELKEELRQKSDTNHSLVEQLADKEIVISELKEQIEKMKCCGNCKHFSFPLNVCYAHERQVWKTFEDTISCGKWELAE